MAIDLAAPARKPGILASMTRVHMDVCIVMRFGTETWPGGDIANMILNPNFCSRRHPTWRTLRKFPISLDCSDRGRVRLRRSGCRAPSPLDPTDPYSYADSVARVDEKTLTLSEPTKQAAG
jgi:hypothetical protein